MKSREITATITVLAVTGVVLLTSCDTFQNFIAGNEDAVASTVDGAGNVGSSILGSILPPPFNILAASAVSGLAAWFSAKVRSYKRGYKNGVTELKGVVSAGRLSDPAFDSSFDATAAATAMRVALANNPALAKAFNKS